MVRTRVQKLSHLPEHRDYPRKGTLGGLKWTKRLWGGVNKQVLNGFELIWIRFGVLLQAAMKE